MLSSRPEPNFARIQRLSRRLQFVCTVALLLPPIILALYWAFYNDLPPAAQAHHRVGILVVGVLQPAVRALAWAVCLLPAGVTMYGLWLLRRLFVFYERGQIFEIENVRCFRGLGRVLLAQAAANVLAVPLLAVVLSSGNPPGQKQLAFSFGSGELMILLLGCVVLVIAAVMEEGRRLAEEQRLTI